MSDVGKKIVSRERTKKPQRLHSLRPCTKTFGALEAPRGRKRYADYRNRNLAMMEELTGAEVNKIMRGEHVPRKPVKLPCPANLTIAMPLPPKALHPNARSHWKAKLRPKKKARVDAHMAAKAAMERAGFRMAPGWGFAEIQSTWYLARKNDPDNLIAWAKNYFDGFADATVVVNDSGFCYWQPQQVTGKAAHGRREVVFRITERRSLSQ